MRFGFLMLSAFLAFTAPAMAADEYGERFTDQAPAGFSDAMPTTLDGIAPQDVEPAAGEVVEDAMPSATSEEPAFAVKPKVKPLRVRPEDNIQ